MNTELRNDISKKILHESFEKNVGTDSGEYVSWYTNDVREAENQGFQDFLQLYGYRIQTFDGSYFFAFY